LRPYRDRRAAEDHKLHIATGHAGSEETFRASGEQDLEGLTYSEIVAHLGKERDDDGLPFTEFIDATQATVALSAAKVRQVVDRLRPEENTIGLL
jgi:hypothetical protein